jgi:NTP pyrophosphatase (non-canonical NTP hydrolase)
MKDYIEKVLVTESPPTDELKVRLCDNARIVHALMGLQTETGEFADHYKRAIFYNKPYDRTNAAEEIGDILWYTAIILDVLGLTFEECMQANIAKLTKRYPNKFNEQDAVNRNLEGERSTLEAHLHVEDLVSKIMQVDDAIVIFANRPVFGNKQILDEKWRELKKAILPK